MTGSLRRTLSLWQVSLSGIGVILGAGVYALVGPAAGHAGNALWLSFLLAGLTAGVTAYAYARLARLAPKNSPEFQYTALAFGPRVGFVAGALMLVADVLAAAAVTIGFGGYLSHLTGTPITGNAIALIVVRGMILFAGVQESVTVAIVLTGLEALGLVFVIVAARRRTPARGAVRAAELVLPALGVLLCAWLLKHASVTSIVVALGLSVVLLAAIWATRAPSTSTAAGLGRP